MAASTNHQRDTRPMGATQRRIYEMLLDGMGHTVDELLTCFDDELTSRKSVRVQICMLRKKLPDGLVIVCVNGGPRKPAYHLFRRVSSSSQG
jgi:hypothetical protein